MTSPHFDRRARLGVSRREVVIGGAAATLALPLAGCGGGTELLFAPFFVFAFQGVVDRLVVNASFAPDAASSGKNSGRFDAANSFINLRNPVTGITVFGTNFSGSFDQRNMQITLVAAQPPLVTSYNGRFSEDDTVVLTPAGAAGAVVTVRRNQNDSFLPTLTGNWTGTDASGAAWQVRLDTDPANSDADATVLLVGTEVRGGGAAVPLLGYASIHYIELSIARAAGNVVLTGTLAPSAAAGPPQVTGTINFTGGGTLRRA